MLDKSVRVLLTAGRSTDHMDWRGRVNVRIARSGIVHCAIEDWVHSFKGVLVRPKFQVNAIFEEQLFKAIGMNQGKARANLKMLFFASQLCMQLNRIECSHRRQNLTRI